MFFFFLLKHGVRLKGCNSVNTLKGGYFRVRNGGVAVHDTKMKGNVWLDLTVNRVLSILRLLLMMWSSEREIYSKLNIRLLQEPRFLFRLVSF